MDPSHPPYNPPPRHPPPSSYNVSSPVVSAREPSSSDALRSAPLPPIHTLDLAPQNIQPHTMTIGPSHVHSMSAGGYSTGVPGPRIGLGTRPAPDDSDPEGGPPGPPKKKRRRQALSCTECKRRKIKCDRAQPCGPCTRRGEQQKCQWHIIEPMEKYVTRAEYDELKGRFEELESVVLRYIPGYQSAVSAGAVTGMPVLAGPSSEPAQGATITPYHHQSSAASNLAQYHNVMPSPRSPMRGEPPSSGSKGPSTPRSPLSSYRPPVTHSTPSRALPPPVPTRGLSPRPSTPSSSLSINSRIPPPPPRPPSGSTPASSRRSSFSLAAITTPFTPDTMPKNPKNREAQTLPWLGQRLRPASVSSGPVQPPSCHTLPPILTDSPSAAAQ